MSRGHHFTHCRYCGKEYVCGDCITDSCEMGERRKRSCAGYQGHMKQLAAQADTFEKVAIRTGKGEAFAGAVLLAQNCHSEIAHEMTDVELSTALMEHVWPDLKIGTKPEALVVEAIERLKKP